MDDEVADEMDEYGYSDLDHAVNEDDENKGVEDNENFFDPEDGDDVVHEFEEQRRVLVMVDNMVRGLEIS